MGEPKIAPSPDVGARQRLVVQNEPLLEPAPSLEGLTPTLVGSEAAGGAVYYGTGLTTPRTLSIGLPFDVLGMVLVAEKLRRLFGLDRIIHHIADTHALTNSFATPQAIDRLAGEAEATMARVAQRLGIGALTVVRSSSFDQTPEYQALLEGIVTDRGDYVRRELADIRWYRERHNLRLKVGWIIQATEVAEGFDERLYDREYHRLFGEDVSFVYTKAGRTFDYRRQKASPYISIPDEQRILLRAGETVREKIERATSTWPDHGSAKTLGGAITHLGNIVRLYDKLIEPTGSGPLPDKVERILAKLFG